MSLMGRLFQASFLVVVIWVSPLIAQNGDHDLGSAKEQGIGSSKQLTNPPASQISESKGIYNWDSPGVSKGESLDGSQVAGIGAAKGDLFFRTPGQAINLRINSGFPVNRGSRNLVHEGIIHSIQSPDFEGIHCSVSWHARNFGEFTESNPIISTNRWVVAVRSRVRPNPPGSLNFDLVVGNVHSGDMKCYPAIGTNGELSLRDLRKIFGELATLSERNQPVPEYIARESYNMGGGKEGPWGWRARWPQ